MNSYKIQHKVQTLSMLDFFDPNGTKVNIDGFELVNWEFSVGKGATGNAWLVTKEIQAETCVEAINIFRKTFHDIASQISLVSQCYFDFLGESFLIERANKNPTKIFLLRNIIDRNPVGLVFTKNHYESLNQLRGIPELLGNSSFFTYMQEANNTLGYYGRLSLLCSALEALSGKTEELQTCGNTKFGYDKAVMKKILGGEKQYNEIFGFNGLRHKIQHGDSINYDKDYASVIYNSIFSYLNNEYKLGLNLEVVDPQRHFYGNKEYISYFYKPNNLKNAIDLRSFDEKFGKYNSPDYESVNPPDGY